VSAAFLPVLAGVFGLSAWLAGRLARGGLGPTVLDHPTDRSLHSKPVPRTGGLAVLASLLAGSGLLAVLRPLPPDAVLVSLGIPAVALAALSFRDDRRGVSVGVRLAAHGAACATALWALHRFDARSASALPSALAAAALILALVWFVNLYNFMDGMDGLAGTMTLFGCALIAIGAWRAGDAPVAGACCVLASATAGFLVWNFPPARVFLGDVGSIPIGFLCGGLATAAVLRGDFDWRYPVLAFLPFLFDATFTLARRILRGERLWEAHREHLYQRAVLAGCSQRWTLAAAALTMAVSGALALWGLTHAAHLPAVFVAGVAFVSFVPLAVRQLERRRVASPPASP